MRKYVPELGLPGALSYYLRAKFGRTPFPMRPPGVAHAVAVRPGTSDRNMFDNVFLDREYDIALDAPPKFILDGGANVGYTSAFFASKYPDCTIVAVEPEDSNFELLQKNVAAFPGVKPVKAGLWPRNTHLYVENPDDVKSGFRLAESDAPRPGAIRALTIESLLDQHGVGVADILKIDVEGAERELFADPAADRWLARTRVLIIELHDRWKPGAAAAVDAALARHPHTREMILDNVICRFTRR